MALTLQKKLELAGDLATLHHLLQRLHRSQKRKKRYEVRNVILASSVIGAVAVYAVVVLRRRGNHDGTVAENGDHAEVSSATEEAKP